MVFSLLVFVPSAGALPATTWWVDIAHGDNTNPGTQALPFRTIDKAVDVCASGSTIMVMPGVYATDAEQEFPIFLSPGVRLRSTDGADETTISGDGLHNTVSIINPTSNTAVIGFTITDTGSSGPTAMNINRTSGGILNGWPLIQDCVFDGCGNLSATGGALRADGVNGSPGAPRIEGTVFRNCVADEGGAAYFGQYTNATLEGCTFEDNSAYRGGGVCTRTEVGLFVNNSSFLGNEADLGGGLSAVDGGGELALDGCEFWYNMASANGGGVLVASYNPNYESVLFAGNQAVSGNGGGLHHLFANPTLTNCLVVGNSSAEPGGAMFSGNGAQTINNCTIADNTSVTWAGLYTSTVGGGFSEVYNSLLWGNGMEDLHGATVVSYTDTQDTNLGDDANSGLDHVVHVNPVFVEPPNDYRLSPQSPCIDAADPGFVVPEDYFGYARPVDGNGDTVAAPDMGYHEYYTPTLARVSGPDRYETAATLATSTWVSNKVAVVVSGENYPDALTAAGLAGLHDCPILLVRPGSVPAATAQAFADLNTEEVILVGGPAAVSETVVIQIADTVGPVERVYGADRYATSAEVARVLAAEQGVSFSKTALIARGDSFPDALALAPLSYRGSQYDDGLPILLTKPGELPAATAGIIDELGIDHAFVAGGLSAVAFGVKDDIDTALIANGGVASTRWAGVDRYSTAVAVAEGGVRQHWARWDRVNVATGTNFPDALAGGAMTGFTDGVIVLTDPTELTSSTEAALELHRSGIYKMTVLGGTTAVGAAAYSAIKAALGIS